MKEDKLHIAIKELPVFDAPDVWTEIEKSLPNQDGKKGFYIGLSLVIVIGMAIFCVNSLNGGAKISHLPKTTNSEIDSSISATQIQDQENQNEISKVTNFSNQQSFVFNRGGFTKLPEASEIAEPLQPLSVNSDTLNYVNNIRRMFFQEELKIVEVGENLVRNPSFEDYSVCPKGIVYNPERKLIPDWFVPTKGTPDYFNVCCDGDAGVPNNFAGKMYAHSGSGYCGIILRQNFTQDNKITGEKPVIYREYIQNELTSELVKGKKYKIKFWICNSSNSRYAVDGIGACVTIDQIKIGNKEVLDGIPVVENPIGKLMLNQDYWVAIEGIYEAQGGEKYLTIGNFNNNYSTNYMMQNGNSDFNYAYYYIDDVSVIEVEEMYQTSFITDSVKAGSNIEIAEF